MAAGFATTNWLATWQRKLKETVDRRVPRTHIWVMQFRLSFAEVPDSDPRFWEERLRAHHIKITASRRSGIDAEGKVNDIEEALGTTIQMLANSVPRFGKLSVKEPGKKAPLAYVPREPTYF